MKCSKVRKTMIEVLYQEAKPEIQLAFEKHLEDCAACTEQFLEYRKIMAAWDSRFPDPQPRKSTSELLLMARMVPVESWWRRFMDRMPMPVRVAAIASVAAVCFISGTLAFQSNNPVDPAISPSGVLMDKSIVEGKGGLFKPLLGSDYVYRDHLVPPATQPSKEKKQPAPDSADPIEP